MTSRKPWLSSLSESCESITECGNERKKKLEATDRGIGNPNKELKKGEKTLTDQNPWILTRQKSLKKNNERRTYVFIAASPGIAPTSVGSERGTGRERLARKEA